MSTFVFFILFINVVDCYEIISYTFKYSPLIGAPSFLKIHKSMYIQTKKNKYNIDFIPSDPTNPEILISLLFNQNVHGDLRLRMSQSNSVENINMNIMENENESDENLSLLNSFIKNYNRDFNLYSNNCYTFCSNLKYFIDEKINAASFPGAGDA